MSDTDDTDALLTCDPTGGLGKTMDDVSSQQLDKTGNTTAETDTSKESSGREKSRSRRKSKNKRKKEAKKEKEKKKEQESTFDTSDFFNSDGDLVLSGLSQFAETTSGSETEVEVSNVSGDSSVDTVDSNTVVPNKNGVGGGTSIKKEDNITTANTTDRKITNCGGAGGEEGNEIVRVNKADVPVDIQRNLKEQLLEANKSNPQFQNMLESETTQIAFGVLNLNLNDLKGVAAGLSRYSDHMFPSPPSSSTASTSAGSGREKVSTFVPTTNDKGEQIFTRAPNFRTPGGYKPSKPPRQCRDLTEDQIREEVRKMYAFPDSVEEPEEENEKSSETNTSTSENNSTENENDKSGPKTTVPADKKEKVGNGNEDEDKEKEKSKPNKVQFNFLDGTPVPSEFGKGKSGKPMKRKLLPNDGGVCGGTQGSIPDLGFGLRNLGGSEEEEGVKEAPVVRTVAWTTGQQITNGAVPPPKQKPGIEENISRFSFGYGEEEDMSPIKSTDLLEGRSGGSKSNSSLLVSQQHVQHTPPEISPSDDSEDHHEAANNSQILQCRTNRTTMATLSKKLEKLEKKRHLKEKFGVSTNLVGDTKNFMTTTPQNQRRLIKKAATKYRAMAASGILGDKLASCDDGAVMTTSNDPRQRQGLEQPLPAGNSIASDLEKILGEMEISPDELESLMEKLDDEEGDFTGASFFADEGDIELDGNFVDAFAELNMNMEVCKKKGGQDHSHDLFTEKFHAEKFKREQCEKELRLLQDSLLAEKQENAVLEGTLKRRNVMLMQITMAFNRVCKEWKKIDSESKATVSKLQHDQKVFAAACKHSQERIAQYEKELHKTLELADSFKTKLTDVQNERDESILMLKEANNELEEKVSKLKEDMDLLKNERDATLRALRESQIKLDEEKRALENLTIHVKILEDKDFESNQKYEELLQAKSQQDSQYMEVVSRRNQLESMVVNLTSELNEEKCSKDQLRRELNEEAERKAKAEAERLHDYYNKKVQEILKSATGEAAKAENVLREQMKRAAIESERKLAECKERYEKDLEILKTRYEAEIEKLKRENLHRQMLISSTVKQLQLGESTNVDLGGGGGVSHFRSLGGGDLNKEQRSLVGGSENNAENGLSQQSRSHLTKFTLDHLPSIMSLSLQQTTNKHTGNKGPSEDDEVPFPFNNHFGCSSHKSSFARYKTSTPIDSVGGTVKNDNDRDSRETSSGSFSNSNQVRNQVVEKSRNLDFVDNADFRNVLSHFLEAPVKPEKEQHQLVSGSNTFVRSNFSENPLDPQLQSCIQELLKTYAEVKLKPADDNENKSDNTSNNNNFKNNKNEIKATISTNKNDGEVQKSLSSTGDETDRSDCQTSQSQIVHSRQESRKQKEKTDLQTSSQGQGQQEQQSIKPPWK